VKRIQQPQPQGPSLNYDRSKTRYGQIYRVNGDSKFPVAPHD